MVRLAVILLLLSSLSAQAQHSKARKVLAKFAEHVSLGGAVDLGMYEVAGGSHARRLAVGLSSAALVAGFKESADALSGADTPKKALIHAVSIMIGAGIASGVKH